MFNGLLKRWRKQRREISLVPCPHCGGDIRHDASSCRHCGSSDADGWSDEGSDGGYYFGDADGDDFDYDQYIEEHHSSSLTSTSLSPLWRAVIVVLVVAFVASLLVPLL
jgi:hypothetical protein